MTVDMYLLIYDDYMRLKLFIFYFWSSDMIDRICIWSFSIIWYPWVSSDHLYIFSFLNLRTNRPFSTVLEVGKVHMFIESPRSGDSRPLRSCLDMFRKSPLCKGVWHFFLSKTLLSLRQRKRDTVRQEIRIRKRNVSAGRSMSLFDVRI